MEAQELARAAWGWSKLAGEPDEAIVSCAGAVISLVNRLEAAPPQGEEWPETIKLGAVMLTARLYRRRNSPNGMEALTDMGATYVSRYDSDIARLLMIDNFQRAVAI